MLANHGSSAQHNVQTGACSSAAIVLISIVMLSCEPFFLHQCLVFMWSVDFSLRSMCYGVVYQALFESNMVHYLLTFNVYEHVCILFVFHGATDSVNKLVTCACLATTYNISTQRLHENEQYIYYY
jgi:hypothetical protein